MNITVPQIRKAIQDIVSEIETHERAINEQLNRLRKLDELLSSCNVVGGAMQNSNDRDVSRTSLTQSVNLPGAKIGMVRQPEWNRVSAPPADTTASFIRDYNALPKTGALSDKASRTDFAKKYGVVYFTCNNTTQRVNNPSLPPAFCDADSVSSSCFWAYPLTEGRYAVVPNQRLSYDETLHNYGGMKESFQSNYTGGAYDHIQVVQPAEYMRYMGRWRLSKQGLLRLE